MAVCCHLSPRRIIRKVPELVEVFASPAGELLNDRNHAVVLCGVSLMLQVMTRWIHRSSIPSIVG